MEFGYDQSVWYIQLALVPIFICVLVYIFKRVTGEITTATPDKMTLDILESNKIPKDWANLDGTDDEDEYDPMAASDEEVDGAVVAGGDHGHSHDGAGAPAHGHSHNGKPCHGHAPQPPPPTHGHSHNGKPCHGHGGGPAGPGMGMPRGPDGKPVDPKTMKLMMLEMVRKKRQNLEEAFEDGEVTEEQYEHHKKNLEDGLKNIQNMPTDPEKIKELQEKAKERMKQNMMRQMAAKKSAYMEAMKKKAQADAIKENDEEINADSDEQTEKIVELREDGKLHETSNKTENKDDPDKLNTGVHYRPKFANKEKIEPKSKGFGESFYG